MKRMIGVLALATMAAFVGCGDDDDDGSDTGGAAGEGGSAGSSGAKGGTAGKGGSAGTAGEGGAPNGEGGAGGEATGAGYDYEAACAPQCENNAACLDSGVGGGGGAVGAAGEAFDLEACIAGCASQAEAGCEAEYQALLDCRGDEETTYECVEDVPGIAVPIGCAAEAQAYGECLDG
jgi:hypothetical protein